MAWPNDNLRLAEALKREFGGLTFSGPTARLAARTALASVLSMVVAMLLHLDDPAWAAITAVSITVPDYAASLLRSLDRCIGTIAGAVIGYVGAHFVADHLVFQAIAAGAVAFGIYGMERANHGYAVLLGAVTVILVMFGSLPAPDTALNLAVYRSLEIIVGVAVSYLVTLALADPRQAAAVAPKPGIFVRPVDRGLLAIAITGGIATAGIPVIWETLQLPGLGQTPITAFVILLAMRKEPAWTALTRLAGCLIGGAYGLICMWLVGDDFVAWLGLFSAGLYVCSHVKQGSGDAAYAGHQAAIGLIVAMIQGLAPSPDILPAINRLVGMIGGIVVVVVAQMLLAPLVARAMAAVTAPEGPAPDGKSDG